MRAGWTRGFGSVPRWKEEEAAMEARQPSGRQVGGGDAAITTRIGAVVLLLGIIVILVAEFFHPAREHPMDNPAVFREYAHSNIWTAVHLAQFFGFLMLLGGLIALYYSVGAEQGAGAGLAPFGLAAAVTTAASFTVLQAVDGVALKRAVDAWVSAPTDREAAAFSAAEAVRWTEMGMNSLSFFLAGLTLFLFGLAIALGRVYPRWVGLMAAVSGALFMVNGVVVAYEGFGPSIIRLVAILLLAVWTFIMAVVMWRYGSRHQRIARSELASRTRASVPRLRVLSEPSQRREDPHRSLPRPRRQPGSRQTLRHVEQVEYRLRLARAGSGLRRSHGQQEARGLREGSGRRGREAGRSGGAYAGPHVRASDIRLCEGDGMS
jgi:hypothetical protein